MSLVVEVEGLLGPGPAAQLGQVEVLVGGGGEGGEGRYASKYRQQRQQEHGRGAEHGGFVVSAAPLFSQHGLSALSAISNRLDSTDDGYEVT